MACASQPRLVPPTHPVDPASTPEPLRILRTLRNPIAMYTEEFFRLPYKRIGRMGRTGLQVMRPDLVQEVLRSPDLQRSEISQRMLRPVLGDGLLTAEGDSWRQQRRAAAAAFGARALDALIPSLDAAGVAAAERLRAQGPIVRVHPQMVRATFDVIVAVLLRRPGRDLPQAQIAADIAAILDTLGRPTLTDLVPELAGLIPWRGWSPRRRRATAAVARLRALAEEIVRARLALPDPGRDLMGLMIRGRDGRRTGLSPAQLVDNTLTFIGAGHETMAVLLSWTLFVLARSEALQDALAEEAHRVLGDGPLTAEGLAALDLHRRVLMETMRLYPPVPIIPRSVRVPTRLAGVDLKPGDHVGVGVYPMHRHAALWSDPFAFDPDRFLPEAVARRPRHQWLPFGAGPRVCIGVRLAMMEATAILARIAPRLRLAPCGARTLPVLTVTLRPSDDVPLRASPR